MAWCNGFVKRTLSLSIKCPLSSSNYTCFKQPLGIRGYAKAKVPGLGKVKGKAGKVGPKLEKIVLPVETDTKRLATEVCGSNIFQKGDDLKLKPDNEYPDWLWTLRTDGHPPLSELDPETEYYWERVKALNKRRNCKLLKLRRF